MTHCILSIGPGLKLCLDNVEVIRKCKLKHIHTLGLVLITTSIKGASLIPIATLLILLEAIMSKTLIKGQPLSFYHHTDN